MPVTKTRRGDLLTVNLSGELNTITAPELDKVWNDSLKGVTELVVDITELTYMSSAGLRTLLSAAKIMESHKGKMTVSHPNDRIREIFELSGFIDIFTVI